MKGSIQKRVGKRGPAYLARVPRGRDENGKRITESKSFPRKREAEDWITIQLAMDPAERAEWYATNEQIQREHDAIYVNHRLRGYPDFLRDWYLDPPSMVSDLRYSGSDEVYFLRARRSGLVKIGVASKVAARVRDIQAHSPERLELVLTIPGSHSIETALHREFRKLRAHGEWFRWEAEIAEFVERSLPNAG